MGICFGSQIIAEALGGKVERMPPLGASILSNGMFIGKEVIAMNNEFFKLDCVRTVIDQN